MHLNILRKINMFDNYILFSIKKYVQNKYLDMLMPIVTDMGNLGIVWIIIAIILILDKPYRMVGSVVILTLIVSTIAGEGIVKHIVRRTRPCNQQNSLNLLISKPISYSFPSGHTLSSFAAAEVLSMYFTEYKLIFIGIAFFNSFIQNVFICSLSNRCYSRSYTWHIMLKANFYNFTRRIYGKGCNVLPKYIMKNCF